MEKLRENAIIVGIVTIIFVLTFFLPNINQRMQASRDISTMKFDLFKIKVNTKFALTVLYFYCY